MDQVEIIQQLTQTSVYVNIHSSFRDSKLQVPVVKFDGPDHYFSGSLLSICIPDLPWDIAKDGDSKADPLRSHHAALEGGDEG